MLNTIARSIYHHVRDTKRQLLRPWEGPALLKARYERIHGKPLSDTPKMFTELLYHRMLEWHEYVDPKYPWLTDKHTVRAYVEQCIGPEYLIDLYWHGYRPDEIPWNVLLQPCVVKPTHMSQQVLVNDGHPNRFHVEQVCKEWLKQNYYWNHREAQYYSLKPAIIIEECLRNEDHSLPLDYKIWCFHGQPAIIQVINSDRDTHSFYSPKWEQLDIAYTQKKQWQERSRPDKLDELLHVAHRLSSEFDFVRVDLYHVKNTVYFGELTFTPTAGALQFADPSWDEHLGYLWRGSC